jgi:hypothetical protein
VLIGEDWKIWRVDFTRAFRLHKDLKDPKDLVRCDRQLFDKLKTLDGNELSARTKGYLTKDWLGGWSVGWAGGAYYGLAWAWNQGFRAGSSAEASEVMKQEQAWV